MSVFQKILRAGEGRTLKRLHERVHEINALEDEIAALSDDALRAKTEEFRERFDQGEDLDDLLPEAFACVREAAKRTLGMRHFDVQLIGGMVLHEGRIAEMKTGEGKTLVATLPLYLNALAGVNVQLVTVNDYLAKRDAEWMGPVYEALGMTVGVIQSEMPDDFEQTNRRAAYACDITYGTNSEFGFDYLRDNMAVELTQTVQRGHWYAIVDEVDSILIDEARTPLIISGQPEQAADTYYSFASAVADLELGADYEVDEKFHTAAPTEEGVDQGRARDRRREPLRARERPAREPPDPGDQGQGALQARRRVRRHGRRGQDRRRVHRPHHGGPALVGGPAPGRRGQGGRADPGGERHRRHRHDPELLPHVREARRHDGHRAHRGQRVPRDLRPRGRADPDAPADGARRQERPDLPHQGGEVRGRRRRHRRAPRASASPCSSARSRSRSRSTSPTCSSAAASRTRC